MIRADLHIHTVSTQWDHPFEFDCGALIEHVKSQRLDAIAITNHNCFDKENYSDVVVPSLTPYNCTVFPGVEVSALDTHILIIADVSKVGELAKCCENLKNMGVHDSLSFDELTNYFPLLSDYLVIPHYSKDPSITEENLELLNTLVHGVETSSMKKALSIRKANTTSVPSVCFTDHRFGSSDDICPNAIYLRTDGRELKDVAAAFRADDGVLLNYAGTNQLEIVPGLLASESLNLIIGKRSTGKTHALNRIVSLCESEDYLHIEQGELVSDSKEDEFYAGLNNEHYNDKYAYMSRWKAILNDAKTRGSEEYRKSKITDYLKELKGFAETSSLADQYSGSPLFKGQPFEINEDGEEQGLIVALTTLLESVEYKEEINSILGREKLIALLRSVVEKAKFKETEKHTAQAANSIIASVRARLSTASTQDKYPDPIIDSVFQNEVFFDHAEKLLCSCWVEKAVFDDKQRGAGKYSLRAIRKKYIDAAAIKGAMGLGQCSMGRITGMSSRDYLDKILSFEECVHPETGLFDLCFEIRDEKGVKPSGGQRTEYTFLKKLADAENYDIILIDEPESSFDNPFLNIHISGRIKELSKTSTVFVTTHNQVLGYALKPNKVLFTKHDSTTDTYHIYSGELQEVNLTNQDGLNEPIKDTMIDLMEAGHTAYANRKDFYENLGS
ncbi:MAG: hypothetical protein RR672_00230 [Raoultibacter sp.]